jgi:hypothetical protein
MIMTEEPPTPERGPGESSRAYRAFCVYRDLGPTRSLDRAWVSFCSAPDQQKRRTSSKHTGCWGEWSRKFNWVERAEAYDDSIEEARREAAEERRQKLEESRSMFESEVQSLAEEQVRNVGSAITRLAKAPLHDLINVKHDPTTSATTTTKISGAKGAEIAQLMKGWAQAATLAINGVRPIKGIEPRKGIVDHVFWEKSPKRRRQEQAKAAETKLAEEQAKAAETKLADSATDQDDLDARLAA